MVFASDFLFRVFLFFCWPRKVSGVGGLATYTGVSFSRSPPHFFLSGAVGIVFSSPPSRTPFARRPDKLSSCMTRRTVFRKGREKLFSYLFHPFQQ